MSISKRQALEALSFGERVAEEEATELSRYFVQTDQWRRLFAGEIDVVYGLKGAGKSALYATLLANEDELTAQGRLLIAAENPRGTPVFKDLVDDPPASESEFRNLWKLYFLQRIGERFLEERFQSSEARQLVAKLEESDLLPAGSGIKRLVRAALDYVRRLSPSGLQGGLDFDQATGLPSGLSAKILFREPSPDDERRGIVSADHLFDIANEALAREGRQVWVLLDRLDVAFAENVELEKNALRALFKVYSDGRSLDRIRLKIFLRSDIWERITAEGFREASHITHDITISWDKMSLMNLVIRRILQSDELSAAFEVSRPVVLRDAQAQEELFYRIFPAQVGVGSKRPTTFDWMMSRTRDGNGINAPRELIHLLVEARGLQLKRSDMGEALPEGSQLISGPTLKAALAPVSRARVEQTLYAENPELRLYIQKLRRAKTQQTAASLSVAWGLSADDAAVVAEELVRVGFFERRGRPEALEYWVPFLYRDALEMSQGAAE